MSSRLETLKLYRDAGGLIARARHGLDDLLHDLDGMERQFGRNAFTCRYRSALCDAKRVLESGIDGAVKVGRDCGDLPEDLTDHIDQGRRLAG